MDDKLLSINELIDWYKKNTDTDISSDFFIYMVTNGLIASKEKSLYSLSQVNDFLLDMDKNKIQVKKNRLKFINQFKATSKRKKFKIASLDGKNFKLLKL